MDAPATETYPVLLARQSSSPPGWSGAGQPAAFGVAQRDLR